MLFSWKALLTPLLSLLAFTSTTSAVNLIESEALQSCQVNSGFTASLFDVTFFPGNGSLEFNIVAISTISGYVTAEIDVAAYGYDAIKKTLDPCSLNLEGLCPLSTGSDIVIQSNVEIPSDVTSQIPGIAYSIPDLDGVVTVKIYNSQTGEQLACVQADLSNGKTVYQKGVGWSTGAVAVLALLVSAIVSGLGHSNAASHIAANAMSLFGFFQSQAFFGMTAVHLPPIASAWTQNFQWSMGIIKLGFIQSIATWYLQATGGTPSTILSSLSTTSVNVQKRDLGALHYISRAAQQAVHNPLIHLASTSVGKTASSFVRRATSQIVKRQSATDYSGKLLTVRGIERVGFRADIELSDIFMTGYIFLVIFFGVVILGLLLFKFGLEAFVRSGKLKSDKFQEFRNGFVTTLRGIIFRLVLIGLPQMVVLGFWELTKQDSAGEMALAVVTVFTMLIMLIWACFRVWLLARRSIHQHKNPAYILYSDPECLHKWGFLYVQFKATTYWWIIPALLYIVTKGLFVALAQNSGITQAIAFLVLEAALLIGLCVVRPYMDKKTNAFNIAISSVNFVSCIFLLFFTDIFGVPGLVVGVMGVIFFILNAAFALILVLMVLIATLYAIFQKNPDVRYQPMRDDRGSFIKSQTRFTTELDALGATARGENKLGYKQEGDDESYQSSWNADTPHNGSGYSAINEPYNKEMLHSPKVGYGGAPYIRENSVRSNNSQVSFMNQNNNLAPNRSQTASPWQRGAGYDR